jgi:hypothetical protein
MYSNLSMISSQPSQHTLEPSLTIRTVLGLREMEGDLEGDGNADHEYDEADYEPRP